MNASWPVVRLGDVLESVSRWETPKLGTQYNQIGVRLWGEGAYARSAIDGSETKYASLNRLDVGDLVVNKIWARNGSVAVIPKALAGGYVSGEFPSFSVIESLVVPNWLHWLTKWKVFWNSCDEMSRGTSGKNRIKPEKFLSINIPLPPLEEQRRIVARIEEVATRVESVRRLRAEQAIQAGSLILSLHESLAAGRELELSEFLELYEDQEPVQLEGAYPQVGVRSFGQGLFPKDAVLGSGTTYRAFNRLYEGAVVLSQVKGWEGALSVCPKDLVGKFVSPEYRTFRCKTEQALPEYLKYLLPTEWFWGRLGDATRGQGARRERTRPEQFLKVRITLPKVEMQAVAIQAFQTARAALQGRSTNAWELDALLPSFLDRAFRGEI